MKKQLITLSMIAGVVAGSIGLAQAGTTLTVTGDVLNTTCKVDVTQNATVQLQALVTDFTASAAGTIANNDPGNTSNDAPSVVEISACRGNFVNYAPKVTVSAGNITNEPTYFSDTPDSPIAIIVSKSPITGTTVDENAANLISAGGELWKGASNAEGTSPTADGPIKINLYAAIAQAGTTVPVAGNSVTSTINFVYGEE